MQKVIEQIQANLQIIYRKAVDADALLASYQQQGKGQYVAIFAEDAPFSTKAKTFEPYVAETCELLDELSAMQDGYSDKEALTQKLQTIVKQIESLMTTLHSFKQSLKAD